MYFSYVDSPVGDLLIAGDAQGLKQVNFPTGKNKTKPAKDWERADLKLKDAREQLKAYFKGELKKFKLKLAPDGTPFQKDVLNALQAIPYGETRSYMDIARAVGRPRACRAVGEANGRNPLAIVIPLPPRDWRVGRINRIRRRVAREKSFVGFRKKIQSIGLCSQKEII